MLIEFFPNPNKKVIPHSPVFGYIPYSSPTDMNPEAKSEYFKTGSKALRYWNMTEAEIEPKALKKECTIDEWIARDKAVRKAYRESHFHVGEKVYPAQYEEYETYGSVTIVGVCRTYDDYGEDRQWSSDTAPLIHLVECSSNNMMLNTSAAWLSLVRPKPKHGNVIDILTDLPQ